MMPGEQVEKVSSPYGTLSNIEIPTEIGRCYLSFPNGMTPEHKLHVLRNVVVQIERENSQTR